MTPVTRPEPLAATLIATAVLAGCAPAPTAPDAPTASAVLGVRSVIVHVTDLPAAREWYSAALGVQPYFDEPYYVGFRIGEAEFGLDPDTAATAPGPGGAVAYLGVADIETAFDRMLALGAEPVSGVQEVGGEVRLVILRDPFGNLFGLVEDPLFYGGRDAP